MLISNIRLNTALRGDPVEAAELLAEEMKKEEGALRRLLPAPAPVPVRLSGSDKEWARRQGKHSPSIEPVVLELLNLSLIGAQLPLWVGRIFRDGDDLRVVIEEREVATADS